VFAYLTYRSLSKIICRELRLRLVCLALPLVKGWRNIVVLTSPVCSRSSNYLARSRLYFGSFRPSFYCLCPVSFCNLWRLLNRQLKDNDNGDSWFLSSHVVSRSDILKVGQGIYCCRSLYPRLCLSLRFVFLFLSSIYLSPLDLFFNPQPASTYLPLYINTLLRYLSTSKDEWRHGR